MQKRPLRLPAVGMILLLVISGCSEPPVPGRDSTKQSQNRIDETPVYTRWYSGEQVATGEPLFQAYCAVCHKADASGTSDWKKTDAAGKYPPPPLNGSAHTWHHSLSVLRRTVTLGGLRLGGTMPGFDDKLAEEQIDAILAWIQSHWSDRIYSIWHERNAEAGKGLLPLSGN